MFLLVLKYISCILTTLVGLYALFMPQKAATFTGLVPQGGRGVTEIRVVLGMFFISLGLYPILTGAEAAFSMLGWAYLFVGIARTISIFIDKSGEQSNWVSVVSEIVFGVILVM